MQKYGKAIAAATLAVLTVVHTLLSDGRISQQEGVQIAIAAVTAFSVWLVPVLSWPWMKTAIAVVLAVLNVAATMIVGGRDHGDLVEFVLALITVLAVGVAPAQSDAPPPPQPTTPA